jgi:uncharacterized membrane protein YfcA
MPDAVQIVASSLFAMLAGALSGFLGIGGGAILPALLVLVLGFEQHRAQAISLAALLPPVGLPALLAYRRAGVVLHGGTVLSLIVGSVGGGLAGAWLTQRIPGEDLRWALAAFLALAAWRAIRPAPPEQRAAEPDRSSSAAARIALGVGALAGAASGLLGVGGGIVALPLLQRFGGLNRLEAQAATLAMTLAPIGLPAVYAYAPGGLPWPLLLAVAMGFSIGAGLGALGVGRVQPRVAARLYAGLLASVALALTLRM